MTVTSRADGGVVPAPATDARSPANHACRSGEPATGERVIAVSVLAARTTACRTRRPGSRLAAGYPECRAMASGDADRWVDDSVVTRDRGVPRAAVCHPWSATRTVPAGRTNVPTPGRESTRPSPES